MNNISPKLWPCATTFTKISLPFIFVKWMENYNFLWLNDFQFKVDFTDIIKSIFCFVLWKQNFGQSCGTWSKFVSLLPIKLRFSCTFIEMGKFSNDFNFSVSGILSVLLFNLDLHVSFKFLYQENWICDEYSIKEIRQPHQRNII